MHKYASDSCFSASRKSSAKEKQHPILTQIMDIPQILKEVNQKTTRYEMNKGSLQGVLDYNPDLESGIREEEGETKNCTREDGWKICIVPLVVGGLLLATKIGHRLYLSLYGIEHDQLI